MTEKKKLSIIIVNYQSEKYLAKCLSSIRERILDVEYEIIVVNNNHLDLDPQGLSEIKTIHIGKNIGFGAACNAGARMAQGEVLCFLNPDTEIVSSDIKKVLDEFDKNKKLAIIGSRLVCEQELSSSSEELSSLGTQEWIAGKEVTILSTLLNNFGYKRDKKIWESKYPIECAWVSGAAMFMRKDIFQKLGGFDEKFFMYFEDIDLCRRICKGGYKILYFPDFKIKHFGGKSFLSKAKQKSYYHTSQYIYFKKCFCKKS